MELSWLRIDDGFVEHPKVMDLSDRAFRLHMSGLCFCARNLTDGLLTERAVKTVCALSGSTRKHLVELREAELWEPLDDAWQIRDYLDYNPDRETAKTLKEKRAEAGRMGGVRSGEARRSKGEANASPFGSGFGRSKRPSPGVEPRPVPGPTPKDLNPTEPVADIPSGKSLEQLQAAARLYEAIPETDRDEGTERIVLGFASQVSVEEFDEVRRSLVRKLGRDELFKGAGAYVNGALQKAARKHSREAA